MVEDRQALTSAYAFSRYFKKMDTDMEEDVCTDDDIQVWKDWRKEHLQPLLDRSHVVK